jgi:hypothetical protein
MASGLYDAAREAFLGGDLDWDANTIKVSLIDAADYTVNFSTHDFYDDVAGGSIVATSGALGSKTKAAGVADAADVTFSAVTGDPSEALILWSDTGGASSTDPLIAYIDSFSAVTPNGGDITVQWDSGANRIFKL